MEVNSNDMDSHPNKDHVIYRSYHVKSLCQYS